MAQFRDGFPVTVPLNTLSRQCSSGLQAVTDVAMGIKGGMINVGICAGVESMTHAGGPGSGSMLPVNLNGLMENKLAKDCLLPTGMTAETVAERYGVTAQMQDAMGVVAAQENGHFKNVAVTLHLKVLLLMQMMAPGNSSGGLVSIETVFKKDGTVAAGTSSQVSDGAAAVLLMLRSKAEELGAKS